MKNENMILKNQVLIMKALFELIESHSELSIELKENISDTKNIIYKNLITKKTMKAMKAKGHEQRTGRKHYIYENKNN